MTYDIAIIGAGPAGSTLARRIHPDFKVLLLDRRDLLEPETPPPDKCCGGLLAPDAQEIFGRMGLAIPKSVLVDPQLFLVRTMDFDSGRERHYQRFYFNMDRTRFDSWLVSLVPDTVDLAFGCKFTGFVEEREGVSFAFTHAGKAHAVHARMLVGADGAWSRVRRQAFPNIGIKRYVAIQEWFPCKDAVPHFGAIFDSEITDFYGWTISKDNWLIVGVALEEGPDIQKKFKRFKEKLADAGYMLGTAAKREGTRINRPMNGKQIITGDDRIALVGESAGFISPSSAEGISYAVKSALILADSLDDGLYGIGARYAKNTRSLRRNILMKNMKKPFMYQPAIRNLAMMSGLFSSRIEPDVIKTRTEE